MPLSTQPYKGARDYYPKDKRFQKFMFMSIRKTVESFGYEEYDAPILEPLEIYQAKTGEEIVNDQTYSFTDRGGRQVVMRPEMTPTVSRMVAAKRNQLSYPLRLYSIPNLWRYERPQRGRFREHWQLNVDIFGEASSLAEMEVICLAEQVLKDFGATSDMYKIKINSRLLMNYITDDFLGLTADKALKLVKLIDRKAKLEKSDFNDQALDIVDDQQLLTSLEQILEAQSLSDLPTSLQATPAFHNLEQLLSSLQGAAGVTNVIYDPTIMRGFDYYTDIVFEIFDVHPENNRSMLGGGRYDGLIGLFGVEPLPTVGFGLGNATLQLFLELNNLVPKLEPETDLALLLIGDLGLKARPFIDKLRAGGLNIAVDFSDRKLGSKIKWAENNGYDLVGIVGENELENNQVKLKRLTTGEEMAVDIAQLADQIKSQALKTD